MENVVISNYNKCSKLTFTQKIEELHARAQRLVKDNSTSLLEFVFDLNFDEIIFPENPIKIVQNKDKDFFRI